MIDRYALSPMKELWTEEAQYARWLEVEIAFVRALEVDGAAPAGTADAIAAQARIDTARIREVESRVDHDVIAFIKVVTEPMGGEAAYFHKGLTSSDIVDTAWSLAMVRAGAILDAAFDDFEAALRTLARNHRETVCVGRTHGVHAEPYCFGLKALSWLAEAERNRVRLRAATKAIAQGKLSGAVGHYGHVTPEQERTALESLGLAPCRIATQVVPRDLHAQFLFVLATIGAGIERIAIEIRHLQRTEVREAEEPFRTEQRGSSAMPHKRNPILSERLCGMARMLRGHVSAALENVALWHERDISHSAVERVSIPDATLLAYYMLRKAGSLLRDLRVFPERMRGTLSASGNLAYSQALLIALIDAGLSREDAYTLVRSLAAAAWESGGNLLALARADANVRRVLTPERLEAAFRPESLLSHVGDIYARFDLETEPKS